MKRALIIGASGQDGTLLSLLLRKKGYAVHGVSRRPLTQCDESSQLDLSDPRELDRLLSAWPCDEIYYLAAEHQSSEAGEGQSSSRRVFEVNLHSFATVLSHVLLQANPARVFYASTSLIYGDGPAGPATESTCAQPRCVYSISKLAATHLGEHFRRQHGLHVSIGILFNHESSFRPAKFLSKRVVAGIKAIKEGRATELVVGDMTAGCDWGYAGDFVDAMWRMLQCDTSDTYVVATGELHTVQDWVRGACALADLDPFQVVREDPTLIVSRRRALLGDSSKLRRATGWRPSTAFSEMVRSMYCSQA